MTGQRLDLRDLYRRECRRPAGTLRVAQHGEIAVAGAPTAPPGPHRVHAHAQRAGNLLIGVAGGGEQHDPGAEHEPLFAGVRTLQLVQAAVLVGVEDDHIRAGHRHQGRSFSEIHKNLVSLTGHNSNWPQARRISHDDRMASPPASTKTSLQQRLHDHTRSQWPQLSAIRTRFHGEFAYVDGEMPDGEILPLMRLRYGGSATRWGFAIYLASKNGYENSVLPTGEFAGTAEDALDCAAGLYLTTPDQPAKDLRH